MKLPDILKGEGLVMTHDLFEELRKDVGLSFELLENDKESQYLRRACVRNVFTYIESIVHILKFEIQQDVKFDESEIELSKKDKEVLYEKKDKNGKLIPIFFPIEANIKKTFNLAARVWETPNFELDLNCESYMFFLEARETRNRLTHPRTWHEIQITDQEMGCMAHAYFWIEESFLSIMDHKIAKINSEIMTD